MLLRKNGQKMPKDAQKNPVILSVGNGGAGDKAPCEERQAKGATLRLSGPRRQRPTIDEIIYGVLRNGHTKERIAESYPERRPMLFNRPGLRRGSLSYATPLQCF
jgi:hypothetical protein